MKVKIELDMLHFMMVYNFLKQAMDGVENRPEHLQYKLFKEAFREIDDQFSEQYTDELGEYFERRHLIRKALYNKS
jgi:hypothetical protein